MSSQFSITAAAGRGTPKAVLAALCLTGCQPSANDAPTEASILQQVTDWPGDENSPRISPDGAFVAFDASVDGNTDIYVQEFATGEVRRLTEDASSDRRPAWSPDGSKIAYLSDRSGAPGIWTMNADGSGDRRIYAAEGVQLGGPDWSPDGTRFATTQIAPEGDGNLVWGRATVLVFDADGENPRELTTKGDEWWPRWGPESEWLYYYVGLTDDIEAVNSRTGDIRSISRGAYTGWRPVPSPDGESILFASEYDRVNIWIAPMDGAHAPIRVSAASDDDVPNFTPGGKNIVFVSNRSVSSVVKVDIETGKRTELPGNGKSPQPLNDGRVAYLSPRAETYDIAIFNPVDNAIETVDSEVSPVLGFAYSPANDKIAVVTIDHVGGLYNIHIIDESGGVTGRKIDDRKAEIPVWCGDNETLLFTAHTHEPGDSSRIWSWNVNTGKVDALTDAAAHIIRPSDCSADNERLAYYRFGRFGRNASVMEKQNGAWRDAGALEGSPARFSPDGSAYAYVDRRDGQTDVFVRNGDGETVQVTNDLLVEDAPRWTPDGKSLVFSVSKPNRDIWMMSLPNLPWAE